MERSHSRIRNCLFDASKNNVTKYDKYLHLCHAHSESERFKRATKEYADSVDQYFYLVQAKDRNEIQVIK